MRTGSKTRFSVFKIISIKSGRKLIVWVMLLEGFHLFFYGWFSWTELTFFFASCKIILKDVMNKRKTREKDKKKRYSMRINHRYNSELKESFMMF